MHGHMDTRTSTTSLQHWRSVGVEHVCETTPTMFCAANKAIITKDEIWVFMMFNELVRCCRL